MKIEKTLIGDDIVSCINILQQELLKEVGTNKRFASEYLKKMVKQPISLPRQKQQLRD